MRTILSLALILGISGGITTLTGCEKKAEHKTESKTTDTMPGGGTKTTSSEQKTTETPPKDEK